MDAERFDGLVKALATGGASRRRLLRGLSGGLLGALGLSGGVGAAPGAGASCSSDADCLDSRCIDGHCRRGGGRTACIAALRACLARARDAEAEAACAAAFAACAAGATCLASGATCFHPRDCCSGQCPIVSVDPTKGRCR